MEKRKEGRKNRGEQGRGESLWKNRKRTRGEKRENMFRKFFWGKGI